VTDQPHDDAGSTAHAWRWPRLLVIAMAAVLLASCRGVVQPQVAALTAVVASSGPPADEAAEAAEPSHSTPAARQSAPALADPAVRPAGCERPCPPLPRLRAAGPLRGGCGPGGCAPGGCGPGASCQPQVCLPPPPVPHVAPCLVCDGGDHGRPARPTARLGLANLSAGDTVARYRADGDGPGTSDVHLVASNCACVYAPRFGSVREVVRPHEEARELGPRGLVRDDSTRAQVDLQPVCRETQSLAPNAARRALPGVAVAERLGPLAIDQGNGPHETIDGVRPEARVRDDQLQSAGLVQTPRMAVGFDVPLAWTCARAAMVVVGRQQADVIASDRGTATLRIESPGRAELTLCKRAGSDTARSGEELDFIIYLHNSGDRPLADIVLADALPARLEYVPDSAAASAPADFSTETGDDGSIVLTWRFRHTFRPGEGGFVRFRTIVR
jgi:uncharacterized repeat protein (TIGR01451 family)